MGKLKWNEALVARFEKEGRGKGEGSAYKPWLYIGDFASAGRTHDPMGLKTQRPHQLFSDNERDFFLMLEWATDVIDIREQFPLAREQTQEVAMQIGARHPFYPGTHVPTVMTVDFMVTRVRDGERFFEAFNVKEAAEAEDEYAMGKLEIQRETLERKGIEHHLVFDSTIPETVARNLGWIRGGQRKPNELELYPGFYDEQMAAMAADLQSRHVDATLVDYCKQFDSQAGLARGTALRVARMLMCGRVLQVDLAHSDLQHLPVADFRVTALPGQPRVMTGQPRQ